MSGVAKIYVIKKSLLVADTLPQQTENEFAHELGRETHPAMPGQYEYKVMKHAALSMRNATRRACRSEQAPSLSALAYAGQYAIAARPIALSRLAIAGD